MNIEANFRCIMSRIHLDYKLLSSEAEASEYRFFSPDFNDDFLYEEIGVLRINKAEGTFSFTPSGIWLNENVLPPEVFDHAEDERDQIIQRKYAGAKFGGWTGRINRLAYKFIKEGDQLD